MLAPLHRPARPITTEGVCVEVSFDGGHTWINANEHLEVSVDALATRLAGTPEGELHSRYRQAALEAGRDIGVRSWPSLTAGEIAAMLTHRALRLVTLATRFPLGSRVGHIDPCFEDVTGHVVEAEGGFMNSTDGPSAHFASDVDDLVCVRQDDGELQWIDAEWLTCL